MRTLRKAFSHPLILSLALAGLIHAPLQANDSDTDPALGVARVSLTNGDVTVQRGDSGDWIEAPVNTPLVAGDTVAVGPGSRAEVQLDHSNFVRLGELSEVRLVELENHRFQLQVARGLVTYVELRGDEAEVEIETSDVAVRPLKAGTYRVQVFETGETEITVRKGKAEVSTRDGSEVLKQGRTMVVRTDPNDGSVEFQTAKASSPDDWDDWNQERNKQLKASASYRRVSRDIYGVEDLDAHGRWVYLPRYGYCWSPYVRAGWAPYRHGRWIWLDYYGWTWASYEPWGWAPYHYGRWYHHAHYGWVWYPRHHYRRHYWRPALVAFFGYGSHSGFHFGVRFGYGHIGWVALGPRDPYYPWYGRHHRRRRHRRHYARTNVHINIYNDYRNARVRGGITVLDARDFSRGRIRNVRSLRAAELRKARLIQGRVPVVPARETLGRFAHRSKQKALKRGGARQAAFYSTRRAKRVQRVPFEEQQKQIVARLRSSNTPGERRAGASEARIRMAGTVGRSSATASGRGSASRAKDARVAAARRNAETRSQQRAGVATAGDRSAARSGAESASRRNTRSWQRFGGNSSGAKGAGVRKSVSGRSRVAPNVQSGSRNRSRTTRQKLESRSNGVSRSRSRPEVNSRSSRSSVRQNQRQRSTARRAAAPASSAVRRSSRSNSNPSRSAGRATTRNTKVTRPSRQAPARTQASKSRASKRPAVSSRARTSARSAGSQSTRSSRGAKARSGSATRSNSGSKSRGGGRSSSRGRQGNSK